MTQTRRTIV